MTVENYKKIVGTNGLKTATNPLIIDNGFVANPTEEALHSYGYYLVNEVPMPDAVEGYYWSPVYTLNGDRIDQSWEQVEIEASDSEIQTPNTEANDSEPIESTTEGAADAE